MNKRAEAIVKAGAIDRAEKHVSEAKRHLGRAMQELVANKPEVGSIIATALLRLDEAHRRLA